MLLCLFELCGNTEIHVQCIIAIVYILKTNYVHVLLSVQIATKVTKHIAKLVVNRGYSIHKWNKTMYGDVRTFGNIT